MGGTNPYLHTPEPLLAQKKYSITYLPQNKTIEVDPTALPTSATGLFGSILDIALASGIEIDHACGGVCACSTCHILVTEGLDSCNLSTDDEEDQLEKAPGLTPQSRLACQSVANGTKNLVIQIPHWNRNLVRE